MLNKCAGRAPIVIDPDEMRKLKRWVDIINRTNGYGGVFNHQTPADKIIVELSTASEWCGSMVAEYGVTTGEPVHNPCDPPDVWVSVNGHRLGVELTELTESEHKGRAAKGETPYADRLFLDTQWSKERLISKLNEAVRNKGDNFHRQEKWIDVLVIHTDEPWLTSSKTHEWLREEQIDTHPNIASAFLLFSYEPGRGVEHWPILRLYGDLGGVRLSELR
jgi:hypothetical protein